MSESKKNKQEREWLIQAFKTRMGYLSESSIDEQIKKIKETTAVIPSKYVSFISDYIELLERKKLIMRDLLKLYSETIKKLQNEDPDVPPGPETQMLFSMYAKCYNHECSNFEVDEIRYDCMYSHIYDTLIDYYYKSKKVEANLATPDQKGEEVEKMLQAYSKVIEQDVLLQKRNKESKDIYEADAMERDIFRLLSHSIQTLFEKIEVEMNQFNERFSVNQHDIELSEQRSRMYDLYASFDMCTKYLKNPQNNPHADIAEKISEMVQSIQNQVVALARAKELDKLKFDDILRIVDNDANQLVQLMREDIVARRKYLNARNDNDNYRY